MDLLDAWTKAVDATWPVGAPAGVIQLRKVVASDVPFTAPECMQRPAKKAWLIYLDEGNTEVGRAAVALTYILALEAEDARRRS